MACGAAIALTGVTFGHFVAALVLIGAGWNFMYTGGTTLLTEAYTPAEKSRTQGANDFIVFSTMALSSFSSGALVSAAGWDVMNWAALPFLALVAVVVVWYARVRSRMVATPA
jgi:MFS family permease